MTQTGPIEKTSEHSLKERTRAILDGDDPRWGKLFESVWAVLIVISVISLALETEPDLSPLLRRILEFEEVIMVMLFSIEYGLRIWSSKHRRRYLFSFWGIIDFVAIAPFYLSFAIDMRSLRILRLLRILRILKLVRYVDALDRLERAFTDIRQEMTVFVFLSAIVLYLSAVGIYYFEHEAQPDKFSSVFGSLWWALATISTVGYGDVYPITPGGRVFTLFVLLVGVGFISIPSGLIASAFTRMKSDQLMPNKSVQQYIAARGDADREGEESDDSKEKDRETEGD